MIECVFTIDYEIFGNGTGSLTELVYEPAEKLKQIFDKWNAKLVVFVEVAELEMIEKHQTDNAINLAKQQICNFYEDNYELGLHLHPQWYNAFYKNGNWILDYDEYNLCILPRERINQIVDRSIDYFRTLLNIDDFIPSSFRAGNWLFQPTKEIAAVLAERGIKIDSSVFKGGVQHHHNLDYRSASKNGYLWRFTEDVNLASPQGDLLEIPIFTLMVPFWKMIRTKRIGIHKKPSSTIGRSNQNIYKNKWNRLRDFIRLRYPLKFDFCRMTITEMISMINEVINLDQEDPLTFKPIVAIGHTKDLIDFEAIDQIIAYLTKNNIRISTFNEISSKCE